MTTRENDIRVSANATDSCPIDITGVNLDTCSVITNAAKSDISNRLYAIPPTYTVADETLPSGLQTKLDSCVEGMCNFVSYDFETETGNLHNNLKYVVDTRPSTNENSTIIIKKQKRTISSVTPGTDGTVTISTTTPHSFQVDGTVSLTISPYIGDFVIFSIPSSTSFTIKAPSQPECPDSTSVTNFGMCCPTGTSQQTASSACTKTETYTLSSVQVCPLSFGGACPTGYVQATSGVLWCIYPGYYTYSQVVPCILGACKPVGQDGVYTRTRVSATSTSCTDTLSVTAVGRNEITVTPSTSDVIYVPQDPTRFVAPPGYVYNSSAINGTLITRKTNATQISCATECTNSSSCEGFNFSSIGDNCELFSSISSTSNVATSEVSFRKEKSLSALSFIPEYNIDKAGRNCTDMTKCNEELTKIVTKNTTFPSFKTSDLPVCTSCPTRSISFYDANTAFLGNTRIIQNEYGFSDMIYYTNINRILDLLVYKDVGGIAPHVSVTSNNRTTYSMTSAKNINNSLFTFSFQPPAQQYLNPGRNTIDTMYLTGQLLTNYVSINNLSYDYTYYSSYNGRDMSYRGRIFQLEPIETLTDGFYIKAILLEWTADHPYSSGMYVTSYNTDKVKYYKYDGTNIVQSDSIPPSTTRWYEAPEFAFILRLSCPTAVPSGYRLSNPRVDCSTTPCTTCPAGTYQTSDLTSVCTPRSDTICTRCEFGYYCPGGTVKTACTAGNYCPAGSATQTACNFTIANGYKWKNPGIDCSIIQCTTAGSYCTRGIESVCSSPSGAQYVTAVCSLTSDTQMATKSCPAGQYASGFTAGSYSSVGSGGTCTNCSSPTGMQIVTMVCSVTNNTVMVQAQACSGYRDGFSNGSYSSTGYGGTCFTCSEPLDTQYVAAVCTNTTNTVINNLTSCPAGKYLSNFSKGSSRTLGRNGTCVDCPAGSNCPGGIYSSSTCPSGYYCPGGLAKACSRCSAKLSITGSYASQPCTATTDTVCSYCPSGYYCPGNENKYPCSSTSSCGPAGVAVQCTASADRICNASCSCSRTGYVPYQAPAASGYNFVCCPSGTTAWGYGVYSCYKNQTYYQAFTCNNNLAIIGGY